MEKKSSVQNNKKKQKLRDLYDESGKKVGVVLPQKEYKRLMDIVDDYHDYKLVVKLQKKKLRDH